MRGALTAALSVLALGHRFLRTSGNEDEGRQCGSSGKGEKKCAEYERPTMLSSSVVPFGFGFLRRPDALLCGLCAGCLTFV